MSSLFHYLFFLSLSFNFLRVSSFLLFLFSTIFIIFFFFYLSLFSPPFFFFFFLSFLFLFHFLLIFLLSSFCFFLYPSQPLLFCLFFCFLVQLVGDTKPKYSTERRPNNISTFIRSTNRQTNMSVVGIGLSSVLKSPLRRAPRRALAQGVGLAPRLGKARLIE